MKKLIAFAILSLAASTSFSQVGFTVSRNSQHQNAYTLSDTIPFYGLETTVAGSFENRGSKKVETASFVLGKTVPLGPFMVGGTVGPQYYHSQTNSGFGVVYALNASFPLGSNLSFVTTVSKFNDRSAVKIDNKIKSYAGFMYKF
jgi:hypothetical protein